MKITGNIGLIAMSIIFLSFAISACSNNSLSRDDAKELIQEAAKSKPSTIPLILGYKRGMYLNRCRFNVGGDLSLGGKDMYTLSILDSWEKKGFIKIVKIRKDFNICQLTEKGKSEIYAGKGKDQIRVSVGERKILEVTGIKVNEAGTSAFAEFTYNVEVNSAGQSLPANIMHSNYWRKLLPQDARKSSARLSLYDDGWRVDALKFK